MKIYYYANGQFEKATGDSIFAESNNSNVVQLKLPMATEGSVVYATFLLPFSQNSDQYGQYKAESLLLTKVVDAEDGGFMYEGLLAEGYLVNSGTAYISGRVQLPAGVATYTASSSSSITIDEETYTISYTAGTPALLQLTDTDSNVYTAIDTNSIMIGDTIFLIGEDNGLLTLTSDIIVKTTEQVRFIVQSGGGYTASAVLPEFGEQLALAIQTINTELYNLGANKQDKVDANINTAQSWQTSTTVVTAINNIIGQVATNKSNIQTNTENIATNASDIATIKQQMITGETYIGTTTGSSLPTGTQLTNYVQTEAGRDPKPGDYVYFILQISGATDKNYKYIYSAVTGWNGSEIPALEEAGNGSLGIIEGTYNVGDTSNTLVDIVGGKIKNIYVKDGDGNYRNIREYSNTLKSTIEGIIDGTYVVGYANKAYKDGDGNTITSTYMTQTAGATKQYVRDYSLPREFNDVYFIDANGYTEEVPTTPASGIQFTLQTDSVGDHQIFQISKQESADYELSSKNSARTVVYISADSDCIIQLRLTTQAQHSGGAWKTLGIDLTQAIELTANTITKVEFTEPFTSLGNEVISITDGDFLRQTLEVVTETSDEINFDIYSNATYLSSFALNSQTMVQKTLAGSLGEEQSFLAIGTANANGVDFALDSEAILNNNTSAEFRLHYVGTIADTDVITLSLNSQDLGLKTPYGSTVVAKQLKQCYYSTDGTETNIRFKGFIKVDSGDNVSIAIEEDNLNGYGTSLSVSGTSLSLKDQSGNTLSTVTTQDTGATVVSNSAYEYAIDFYNTFTTTEEYVGYYVRVGSSGYLVNNSNKDSLGIVPGTTEAYLLSNVVTNGQYFENNRTLSLAKSINALTPNDVDTALSSTSSKPVQNKVVNNALESVNTQLGNKADKSATVSNVSYDDANKKIQQTINGTTTDVATFSAGSNVSLSSSSGTLTINATDTTYSNLSPAEGGNDVSLVTTGEKYTWNSKQNALPTTSTASKVLKSTSTAGTTEWGSVAYSEVTGTPTLGTASALNTGTSQGDIPVLGTNGKLASSVVPASAITDTFVVNSQAAMLALSTAEVGDVAVRTDINKSFILKAEPYSTLANWQELLTPTDAVTSVNSQTGAVVLTASNVGALADSTKYGKSLSVSGTSVSLKDQDGTTLSTITTQDTTYSNQSASQGGTAVSLVTTGEKYTWDNKQDALPTTSTAGNVLKSTSTAGTVQWGTLSASDVSALSSSTKYGASLSVSGTSVQLKDQDGNNLGSAITTQDTTYSQATTNSAGLMPALDSASVGTQTQSTKFLREDGTWQAPSYSKNITITTTSGSESVSDGTNTLNFGSNAFNSTAIPSTTSSVTQDSTDALTSGGAYTAFAYKVDKTSTANQIYGTDNSGNQTTYDKNLFHTTDFYQLRINAAQALTSSADTKIVGLRSVISNIHNNSLVLDTNNNTLTVGQGVSTVKITMVIQYRQVSEVTRFGGLVKINGNNVTNGGSYAGGVCSDLTNSTLAAAERRVRVTNVFIANVNQNDVITFWAKSTGATSSSQDLLTDTDGQTHFIVEVIK